MNDSIQKQSLTVLKFAAFIIIIAGIIFAKSIIVPFLMSLFISIICAQPVSWLVKKKVPKGVAVLIVLIGILAIFFGFGYMIGGAVSSFTSNAPKYSASLNTISDSFIHFLNGHGIEVSGQHFSKLFEPSMILNFTAQAVNELVNMMGNAFLMLLTILFMLLEISDIPVKLKAIFHGSDSLDYLTEIINSIRHYLGIKTLISLAVSVLIFVALTIIGLDYAILWALIAGLMNYIPNIGSIIAVIPALLLALVQLGSVGAIWVLVSYLAVNNILGNFVEPRIMGKGLGLSTLVVFLSLIFWGFILGTVGMFLSVPLTITIKIILEHNEKTKWIAILLGTPHDAKVHLAKREKDSPVRRD
jgi:AI-2 transport protein TqsA